MKLSKLSSPVCRSFPRLHCQKLSQFRAHYIVAVPFEGSTPPKFRRRGGYPPKHIDIFQRIILNYIFLAISSFNFRSIDSSQLVDHSKIGCKSVLVFLRFWDFISRFEYFHKCSFVWRKILEIRRSKYWSYSDGKSTGLTDPIAVWWLLYRLFFQPQSQLNW